MHIPLPRLIMLLMSAMMKNPSKKWYILKLGLLSNLEFYLDKAAIGSGRGWPAAMGLGGWGRGCVMH